jgi:hypothetical protein
MAGVVIPEGSWREARDDMLGMKIRRGQYDITSIAGVCSGAAAYKIPRIASQEDIIISHIK